MLALCTTSTSACSDRLKRDGHITDRAARGAFESRREEGDRTAKRLGKRNRIGSKISALFLNDKLLIAERQG